MLQLNDVVEFIHNPLAYEQKLVYKINTKGEQILLSSFSELYEDNVTIKVEGFEKYSANIWNRAKYYALKNNHSGPITCHVFVAHPKSPSFPMHTDPDDVIIYCAEGKKTLIVDGEYIILEAGQDVLIPANTPHQAINDEFALTLSFGLEKYLTEKLNHELDVLPKDHGDV